jgi:hypothetical protein
MDIYDKIIACINILEPAVVGLLAVFNQSGLDPIVYQSSLFLIAGVNLLGLIKNYKKSK